MVTCQSMPAGVEPLFCLMITGCLNAVSQTFNPFDNVTWQEQYITIKWIYLYLWRLWFILGTIIFHSLFVIINLLHVPELILRLYVFIGVFYDGQNGTPSRKMNGKDELFIYNILIICGIFQACENRVMVSLLVLCVVNRVARTPVWTNKKL
jgi:hypothetical protein